MFFSNLNQSSVLVKRLAIKVISPVCALPSPSSLIETVYQKDDQTLLDLTQKLAAKGFADT